MPKSRAGKQYKKAPGSPRRFKSAYIFFSGQKHKEIRLELAKKNEKRTTPDIAKMVSLAWRDLPAKDRAHWEKLAVRDRARFNMEMSNYKGPMKVPIDFKAEKDPFRPRRPMPAFLAFSSDKRQEVKNANPGIGATEISAIVSKMWKEAKPDEKKIYLDRVAGHYVQYKRELQVYAKHKELSRKKYEDLVVLQAVAAGMCSREDGLEDKKPSSDDGIPEHTSPEVINEKIFDKAIISNLSNVPALDDYELCLDPAAVPSTGFNLHRTSDRNERKGKALPEEARSMYSEVCAASVPSSKDSSTVCNQNRLNDRSEQKGGSILPHAVHSEATAKSISKNHDQSIVSDPEEQDIPLFAQAIDEYEEACSILSYETAAFGTEDDFEPLPYFHTITPVSSQGSCEDFEEQTEEGSTDGESFESVSRKDPVPLVSPETKMRPIVQGIPSCGSLFDGIYMIPQLGWAGQSGPRHIPNHAPLGYWKPSGMNDEASTSDDLFGGFPSRPYAYFAQQTPMAVMPPTARPSGLAVASPTAKGRPVLSFPHVSFPGVPFVSPTANARPIMPFGQVHTSPDVASSRSYCPSIQRSPDSVVGWSSHQPSPTALRYKTAQLPSESSSPGGGDCSSKMSCKGRDNNVEA